MKRTTRFVAAFAAFALVQLSFGPRAWAQVATVGAISAPVGGQSASAAAATSARIAPGSITASPALSAGLSGSLLAPSAPAAVVAPALTAVAAPAAPAAPSGVAGFATTAAGANAPANSSVRALESDAPANASISAAAKGDTRPAAAAPEAKSPRGASIASRAAARFAELRAYFGGKSAPAAPSSSEVPAVSAAKAPAAHNSELLPTEGAEALRPQSGGAVNEPPAPPAPPKGPEGPKKGKGWAWFGLGSVVATLIAGMLVQQLGLEAQGAAMAQLTEDAFGDFSILAQVAIFASIGSMVGQQLAQFFSAKFGLTKVFYGAHILRAVSLGVMVFLLGTGMMPLPLMFAFYAFNGAVTGIAATAEGTLRKFILAEQGISQQKFRTWWQLLAEIVAVPAPMVFGALVPVLGASLITAIYPATILAGLMIFFMFKVIPWASAQRVEARVAKASADIQAAATPAADPGAPKKGAWTRVKDAFKQIFNSMEEGKSFVLSNALLKFAILPAMVFDLMNVLIYRLITPGYGKLVAGSTGMAAVQGNLVGMFSLGGLILAITFLLLERRAKAKDATKTPEEKAAAERSSLLRWTMLGVPALALLGMMAFQIALPFAPLVFLGVDWLPTSAFAAALIPFGFFQVAASIKLNSYFAEKLPADPAKVQKAIAFSGSAMTALSIMLMLSMKPLFGDMAAFNPFPWLAAALIPVGALLFYLQRKLAGATAGDAAKAGFVDAAPSGGYAGLLLGVIAAALVLTAMPFVPGVGAWMAALSVLGKFALHLGATLALPAIGYAVDKALRRRAK